jgi:hypothetical protein
MELYDHDSLTGRRGVLPLKDAIAIVNKKVKLREKKQSFVDKFGADAGWKESGFFSKDSIY